MINLSIENLAGTMKQGVFRKYKLEDLVFSLQSENTKLRTKWILSKVPHQRLFYREVLHK